MCSHNKQQKQNRRQGVAIVSKTFQMATLRVFTYACMNICVYVCWCFVYANVNSNRNNNRSTRNLLLRYFFSSWIFMVSSRFFCPLLHAVCLCVFKCFTLRRQRECERNRQHLNQLILIWIAAAGLHFTSSHVHTHAHTTNTLFMCIRVSLFSVISIAQ